jgi:hypothetical protein
MRREREAEKNREELKLKWRDKRAKNCDEINRYLRERRAKRKAQARLASRVANIRALVSRPIRIALQKYRRGRAAYIGG